MTPRPNCAGLPVTGEIRRDVHGRPPIVGDQLGRDRRVGRAVASFVLALGLDHGPVGGLVALDIGADPVVLQGNWPQLDLGRSSELVAVPRG